MYSDEENEESEEVVTIDPKVKQFLSGFSIPRSAPTLTQEKLMKLSGTSDNITSSPGNGSVSPSKKRPRQYDQSTWTTSWASNYDRPIPQSVLEKCTVEECKMCDLQFTNIIVGKQHYEGQKHAKKVIKYLSEQLPEGEVPCKKAKIEVDVDKSVTDFLSRMGEEVEKSDSDSWGSKKLSDLQQEVADLWDRPIPSQIIGLCRSTKCDICEATFTSGLMARSHFTGRKHDKKFTDFLKVFCEKNNVEMPNKKSTTSGTDTNKVTMSDSMCQLCDVKITSPAMADLHYKGKQHRKRELSGVTKADTKEDPSGRFGIGKDFSKKDKTLNNGDVNAFRCGTCNIETTSELTLQTHYTGKTHLKNVAKGGQTSNGGGLTSHGGGLTFNANGGYKTSNGGGQTSTGGGQTSSSGGLGYYSETSTSNGKEKNDSMNCCMCNVECTGEPQWLAHINSKKHISRMASGIVKPKNGAPVKPPVGNFRCEVCDIATLDQGMLDAHLGGKKHAAKVKATLD